jgi:hypothetical protein
MIQPGCSSERVDCVSVPNIRNYSSTGLAANKTYFYRVRAFKTLG